MLRLCIIDSHGRAALHLSRWRDACAIVLVFCASSIKAQDARWLHDNDRANRYEGLLDQPNAKRAYDILGFSGFGQNLEKIPPDKSAVNLHVGYCLSEPVPVFIEARQVRGRTQYLMKSKDAPHLKGWNIFQPWPVNTVLFAYGIDPNALGIVARLNSDNEYAEYLAPAIFYADQPPAHISQYSLSITVRQKRANLTYDYAAGTHTPRKCFFSPSQPCLPAARGDMSVEAGGVIPLILEFEDFPAGSATVHITGSYANSDEKLFAQFHFSHFPECK